ncbi:MAG: PH domain-containing protein [Planctomycetes bacterium]|nr:PH domain-containing protein [Planctomycetota bacterium]
MSDVTESFDPRTITRPDHSLLSYYTVISALTLIAFPFVFLPLYFKYHTLRYAFDDKGVAMSWGILFRREIYLTYRRIQDIHVSRGIIQRWFGLASVAIQTASGSAGAEMTVVGVLQPEMLRDFLYSKMRGGQERGDDTADGVEDATDADEALALLREIRDELKHLGRDGGETAP